MNQVYDTTTFWNSHLDLGFTPFIEPKAKGNLSTGPKKKKHTKSNKLFLLKQSENVSSDHEKPSKMFVRLKEVPT